MKNNEKTKPMNENKPTQCVQCQRTNHKSEDCFFKPCTYCRTNHKSENCFPKTGGRETQKKYALLVEECKQDEVYNMEEKGDKVWTVDSGCIEHMINDNEYLIDQKQYNSAIKRARKGNTMRTVSTGKFEGEECVLNDVIFVPDTNLMSVHAITENGGSVVFIKEEVKIYVEDELVLIGGKSRNGLYEVKIMPDKESLLTEEEAEDWHRKLGHPSKDHTAKIKHLCSSQFHQDRQALKMMPMASKSFC